MSNISPNYRRAAELAGLSTETGRTLAALAVACDALWEIAGFAIQAGAAPETENAEDTYDNGENAALWMDGMTALKALAQMGDAKAAEIHAANLELEDARDAGDEESAPEATRWVKFVGQAWVNNNAITVDDATVRYGVTEAEYRAAGGNDAGHYDALAQAARAPQWVKDWPGPFEVYPEPDTEGENPDGEHPTNTRAMWRAAILGGETRGYWEWSQAYPAEGAAQ